MFCVGDRVRLVQLDPNESPYFPEMVDLVGKLFLVAQVNRYSMGYTTCECYEVDDENAGTWVLRVGYRDWETDRKSTRLNASHRL